MEGCIWELHNTSARKMDVMNDSTISASHPALTDEEIRVRIHNNLCSAAQRTNRAFAKEMGLGDPSERETQVLNWLNNIRQSQGLPPSTFDDFLEPLVTVDSLFEIGAGHVAR